MTHAGNNDSSTADANRRCVERLVRLSSRIEWGCFCDEMENSLPHLHDFLETWGKHCGAPRTVFRGQLCKMMLEIWKANIPAQTPEGPQAP